VSEGVNVGGVKLPTRIYWRIAARAEKSGRTVGEEIIAALAMQVEHDGDPDDDPFARLWRQGLADREIAARLGWTNQQAADTRRRRMLPANRKPRVA
jgi:hypothetical protein